MKKLLFISIIFISIFCSVALSAQNPFFSGEKKEQKIVAKSIPYPEFIQPVLSKITLWQKELRTLLSGFGRDIHKNPYGKSFWLFLMFSFAYGVIHALGPGHGKSIVCSYFISCKGKYIHGIILGYLIMIIHVFSAVIVIFILYFIFQTTGLTSFESVNTSLEKISYGFLIIIGLFLFGHNVYELKAGKFKNIKEDSEDSQENNLRNLLIMALATGLIPCPGAALILIFAISLKIFIPGIIAMIFISMGMGLTNTLFALFTIASRNAYFQLASQNQKFLLISHTMLSFTGALAITAIGTLLFIGR
ncbi:nickel/cobalt transporter (NicO) family protein [Candidatus Magnetomoraceae bacterium gMMP-15]